MLRAELPTTLVANADLDRWVAVNVDGTVTVRSGKVELGQGLRTALTLIAADELVLEPQQVRVLMADTALAPDEGITAGSMSIETGGAALRQACAQARHLLLAAAARALGVLVDELQVEAGRVSGGGPAGGRGANRSISYFELQGGQPFAFRMQTPVAERARSAQSLVGRGMARVDLAAKVRGAPVFVYDLAWPGMLHARVVRPPSLRHRLTAIDNAAIAALPGLVACIRDGSFVAVVAEREAQAVVLRDRVAALIDWRLQPGNDLPDDLSAHLKANERAVLLLEAGTPVSTPPPPFTPPPGTHVLAATYTRPFQMHASLAPSAAAAEFADGHLTVWSHSQGVGILRRCLAHVLGMSSESVRVIHVEGAGAYGHNGADDAALDAALVARALSARALPARVLLKWTRSDEHLFEPYGPAAHIELAAALDADGSIVDWSHDVWSYTHSGRPSPPRADASSGDGVNLLSAWMLETPFAPQPVQAGRGPHGGIHRNADPLYAFPRRRIVKRLCAPSPLRTSSLRGLGAFANVFAIESFIDELAAHAAAEPVAYRLRHLQDVRARAVIERVRDLAAATPLPKRADGFSVGRGLGFAQYKNRQCYCAVIAECAVREATAEVSVRRAFIAADAGSVVDPDGLVNQLEGGLVQATSWTLREAVRHDAECVTSTDWNSYPILRFTEVPEVQTVLIDRPELPSLGAGEASQGPTAAAIANAVFAATGVRVRDLPVDAVRVRKAAGAMA